MSSLRSRRPTYMMNMRRPLQTKHNNLPDFLGLIKGLFKKKKNILNQFLSPIFELKRSLFNSKKKLVTPLLKPIFQLKRRKLGFLRGLLDKKITLVDKLNRNSLTSYKSPRSRWGKQI